MHEVTFRNLNYYLNNNSVDLENSIQGKRIFKLKKKKIEKFMKAK